MTTKSPAYTNRILREAGVLKPRRDTMIANLKRRIEELEDRLIKETRRGDLLQIDLDLALGALRDFRDWEQKAAQIAARNGEYT